MHQNYNRLWVIEENFPSFCELWELDSNQVWKILSKVGNNLEDILQYEAFWLDYDQNGEPYNSFNNFIYNFF